MTDVAAEFGKRNEDLARVGDQPAVRGIAQGRGFCYQFGQWRVEPQPPLLSTGYRHEPSFLPAEGRMSSRDALAATRQRPHGVAST
jgi:hypothetical protein